MAVFLDLHVLQSIPFANLNRDELGSPKSVRYGGAERTRVSSQAWKREIRFDVEARMGEYAKRTRLVPAKVAQALASAGWPAELAEFAGEQVVRSANKDGLKIEEAGHTSVLLFIAESAIDELAAVCQTHRTQLEEAAAAVAKSGTKAKATKAKSDAILPSAEVSAILKSRTIGIDLFGRMLAELPGGKVDGAVQVAHAFTTHASDPQLDFFTAVDDWLPEEQTGSGHMQTGEFAAGVFYRYATVNIDDLVRNTKDTTRARQAVEYFADAFLYSMPKSKKNSTAPHTVPDLAYIAVRDGRPVSLAAAFEKPVRASYAGGVAEPSRLALAAYAGTIDRLTGARGRLVHGHAGVDDKPLEGLGDPHASFGALVQAMTSAAFADRTAL